MASSSESGEGYALWGEFEHGVDDKGRVVMPQEFRETLKDDFVVARGPERSIFVFPLPVWQKIETTLNGGVLDRRKSFLRQMMAGSRTVVRLDPQSRLAIPKHLRDWSGITPSQSAVIIGQGSKLEIWSKAAWDVHTARFTYDTLFDAADAVGLAEVLPA